MYRRTRLPQRRRKPGPSLSRGQLLHSIAIASLRTLFRQPTIAQPSYLDFAAAAIALEALSHSKSDHERTDDESGVGPHHALTYSTFNLVNIVRYEFIRRQSLSC